ncbi:hypothetical protein [Vibrio aestuarianus]|uniref:hypothetical protein n=1 Tax=Vibrio aestuarianus TaxID=28171 RepID=UPI0030C71D6A
MQEIGTASLKNFMTLAMNWFNHDFSRTTSTSCLYHFFIFQMSLVLALIVKLSQTS